MSAVQIAGCSGAGKSAVAAVLARRGLVAVDADDDPLLARFVDPAGAVVAEMPAAPDLGWLARHGWAWDPGRLDELIWAAAPTTLYVCGDTRTYLRRKLPVLQDSLRASGAIPIDARQPLDQVADAILSRTLLLRGGEPTIAGRLTAVSGQRFTVTSIVSWRANPAFGNLPFAAIATQRHLHARPDWASGEAADEGQRRVRDLLPPVVDG